MVTARATSASGVVCWRLVLLVLLASLGVLGCGGGQRNVERADFRAGRELVIEGRFAKAVPLLEKHLEQHPSGKHRTKAGLFLGKAHLGLGQLSRARAAFARAAKSHPQSVEGHKCSYKVAMVDLLLGQREQALSGFDGLANSPSGPLAGEAKAMAAYLRKPGSSAPRP